MQFTVPGGNGQTPGRRGLRRAITEGGEAMSIKAVEHVFSSVRFYKHA
jgi:hypothetical protein